MQQPGRSPAAVTGGRVGVRPVLVGSRPAEPVDDLGLDDLAFTGAELGDLLEDDALGLHGIGDALTASEFASLALGKVGLWTILAPRLRRRIDLAFVVCRAWRADYRKSAIAALKVEKRSPSPDFVAAAGAEIAAMAMSLFGPGAFDCVASIACGHSRTPECMGKQLAAATAERINVPYRKLFRDRFVAGSSHPKGFRDLPPLRWQAEPAGRVLLVDDVATSGWHLKEAADMIRARSCAVSALAWIGGELKAIDDGL